MESAVTPWLDVFVSGELLLAHRWLQRKIVGRGQGIAPVYYDPSYVDSGSLLEIKIVGASDQPLSVLSTSPLLVSDGAFFLEAALSPACRRRLASRRPNDLDPFPRLDQLVYLHEYTIACTTLGPPLDKVFLIVDNLRWQHAPAAPSACEPRHLCSSAQILDELRSLEELRELQDSTVAHQVAVIESEKMSRAGSEVGGADTLDDPFAPSLTDAHTQAAFGTQFVQDCTSATEERANAIDPAKLNQLLTLLAPQRKQDPPVARTGNLAGSLTRPAPLQPGLSGEMVLGREQNLREHDDSATALTVQRLDPQDRDHDQGQGPAGEQRNTENDSHGTSPEGPIVHPSKDQQNHASPSRNRKSVATDASLTDAEWMHGLRFDAAAAPTQDQQTVLERHNSWHKPLPGHQPLDGNIPVDLYTEILKLAKEHAEAAEDSEDDSDDSDDDEEGQDSQDLNMQSPILANEDAEFQMSWSSSVSPQVARVQATSTQARDLPPDSSLLQSQEPPAKGPEPSQLRPSSTQRQSLPPDSSLEHHVASPDRPLESNSPAPAPSTSIQPIPASPASSPPVPVVVDEDDMELDVEVPQGLGEDHPQNALPSVSPQSCVPRTQKRILSKEAPVVQVKETPYRQAKAVPLSVQARDVPAGQGQTSSGSSKSTSIIPGTYNHRDASDQHESSNLDRPRTTMSEDDESATCHVGSHKTDAPAPDVIMVDVSLLDTQGRHNSHAMETTDVRNAGRPSDSGSSPVRSSKRKSGASPVNKTAKHTKRRAIQVKPHAFAQDSSSSPDHGARLRQDRRNFMLQIEKERQSSVSSKILSEAGSTTGGGQRMSTSPVASHTRDVNQNSGLAQSLHNLNVVALPIAKGDELGDDANSGSRDVQVPAENAARQTVDIMTPSRSAALKEASSLTIFDHFKNMYPEYKGNSTHFVNVCKQIQKLDDDDKMVPKRHWDDYLIRNRTDYATYCSSSLDTGEDPLPWHRYYKDYIQETIYKQGVIKDRATLDQAVTEMSGTPIRSGITANQPTSSSRPLLPSYHDSPRVTPASSPLPDPRNIQAPRSIPRQTTESNVTEPSRIRQPKRPHSFGNSEKPSSSESPQRNVRRIQGLQKQIPRSSLGSGQRTGTAPPRSSSTSRHSGQHFRDFVLAQQKMTSWTGSTQEDIRKPWPESLNGRPSLPGPRAANVLSWQDEL